MKAILALSIAALLLATPSLAAKKRNTAQIQAATSNVQTSIRYVRLRARVQYSTVNVAGY
jgi:hypothetical protein